MKLVLDTNILVSSLLTHGTPPDLLYRAWETGRLTLVTSPRQIDELTRVLTYEKLRPYIQPIEASLLLENLDSMAVIVEPSEPRTESTEPDDNWILANAIWSQADFIVTGDKGHLLNLGSIHGIPILTAREAAIRLGLG